MNGVLDELTIARDLSIGESGEDAIKLKLLVDVFISLRLL